MVSDNRILSMAINNKKVQKTLPQVDILPLRLGIMIAKPDLNGNIYECEEGSLKGMCGYMTNHTDTAGNHIIWYPTGRTIGLGATLSTKVVNHYSRCR